jgi:hypothetical protein
MEQIRQTTDAIMSDSVAKVVYFATLLVLILLLVWCMKGGKRSEHYTGGGIMLAPFSSGASQRHAQEFTGTNQGAYSIIHNNDLQQWVPGSTGPGPYAAPAMATPVGERLVNERGEPDFWEISSELDSYRNKQNSGYQAALASAVAAAPPASAIPTSLTTPPATGTEHWATGTIGTVEDYMLTSHMY